jgi:hypothetical protein
MVMVVVAMGTMMTSEYLNEKIGGGDVNECNG